MSLDRHHKAFEALLAGPSPSLEQIDQFLADLRRDYAPDDLIAAVRRYRQAMVAVWGLRAVAALGARVGTA